MNDYAWHHRNRTNTAYVVGRRSSNNVVVGNRTNIIRDRVIVNRNKLRVYNNPNNPNLNNNSKPRVYVRPNNNSNNNNPPRIYTRPSSNNSTSTTRPSSNVSRSNSVSRGGNSNRKN